MANIAVHKGGSAPIASLLGEWDPWRAMRNMLRWDPFQEMAPVLPGEDRGPSFVPTFEVCENKDGFVFKADVPGVKEQDLDVTLVGNRLTISGKREAEHTEKSDTYYCYERNYGTFARAFTLPEGVDSEHIRAELKDGVLTLGLSKLPEAQAKRIAIRSGEKSRT